MDCIMCDEPKRQKWNEDYCSPTCVLVGELVLDIEAHNHGMRDLP
jgi:hypothetical protein